MYTISRKSMVDLTEVVNSEFHSINLESATFLNIGADSRYLILLHSCLDPLPSLTIVDYVGRNSIIVHIIPHAHTISTSQPSN